MINKVSFMGRETCLTNTIKKAAKPAEDFVADGAVLKETAVKAVDKAETIAKEEVAKLNEAYKAAHAPFILKKNATVAEEFEDSYKAAHNIQC